jgi:hypothetical protein
MPDYPRMASPGNTKSRGIQIGQVFLAELDTTGKLYVDLCQNGAQKPEII